MVKHLVSDGRNTWKTLFIVMNFNSKPSNRVNLEYFNTHLKGNPDLLKEIIKHFVEDAPYSMDEMMNSVSVNDWNNVRRLAHRLKPNIDTFGIHALRGVIRQIEANTRYEINLNDVPNLVREAQLELHEAVKELKTYIED